MLLPISPKWRRGRFLPHHILASQPVSPTQHPPVRQPSRLLALPPLHPRQLHLHRRNHLLDLRAAQRRSGLDVGVSTGRGSGDGMYSGPIAAGSGGESAGGFANGILS